MYYDSEIKNYFDLLDEIEDVISNWWTTITLDWITYETSQFHEIYESRYQKTATQSFSDMVKSIIPSKITNKYEQLKSEYLENLRKM